MIVQHDTGSAQQGISPKHLNCSHQTKDRTKAPNKKINVAIFDNLDLRKYHVELGSLRYPRDTLLLNYEQNDHIEQNNYLNMFFKE